ncbi:hypothetical protein WDV06_27260 [Streptomyces racemochromogenes]|uniref:LPXTG cell wall anchor domain-containing protein n=1 Tax=Streptomyces racemochromogenes TaxID=67353 RepID=A0ABW7PK12_9ACTN
MGKDRTGYAWPAALLAGAAAAVAAYRLRRRRSRQDADTAPTGG